MKIILRILAAAAAAAVLGVAPANAVIGGSLDGNAHPYVGLVAFFDSSGTFIQRCTGFLIPPGNSFVTAGHCAGPEFPGAPQPASAKIWFNGTTPVGSLNDTPDAIGVPEASPAWNGVTAEHDIGVVHLSSPVTNRGFAALPPTLGYLDRLTTQRGTQDVSFTVVGYGVQDIGPTGVVAIRMRFAGTVQLEKLTDIDLLTTAAPGTGTGGSATCLGDSGGPVFHDGFVVAIVSGGLKFCNGKAADFRLDTVEAQDFINSTNS